MSLGPRTAQSSTERVTPHGTGEISVFGLRDGATSGPPDRWIHVADILTRATRTWSQTFRSAFLVFVLGLTVGPVPWALLVSLFGTGS